MQRMMHVKNYAEFAAHIKEHDEFIDRINKYTVPVKSEQVHYAKSWSVNVG